MSYFETADGTRLHFADWGPAGGRTLVFTSGAYFGTEMWEHQMLPLATEGFRCVALERRGHGRSDNCWTGYDLDTLADDLAALLEHLDLTDVTLVGHSVGTAEIVRCLTRHGSDRVARAALVAGAVPGIVRSTDLPEGMDPAVIAAANETMRADRAQFFHAIREPFFGVGLPGVEISAEHMEYLIGAALTATPKAVREVSDLLVTLDLAAEMPKIDVPVLVVHGTHDVWNPVELTGRRSAELIPDSTLTVYQNAAHGLFATHAARLTADLREFAGE
ncbi:MULTISPECIES: alpha/beta fold hydrolase [unclassified Kitasatospora]|uniref:alpha/beta fold hydrolase n=1 Tax=unclassified Kitasatospora TaxID=2633591 RepID=UPI000708D4D6|nr:MULTISPECIES: alpha/beta hydrolase [unclassified Kitasatospora]KQV22840.1 chloroperoxidase [Kitasatospora sp. Root107]KRB61699.1 chloroperoxidase [Kitasatospora sp. Root187]